MQNKELETATDNGASQSSGWPRRYTPVLGVAFSAAPIGIAIIDLDGCFERVNPRFVEMLAYPEEELEGKSFRDFTHPEDIGVEAAHIARLVSGEIDRFSLEKRYLCAEGRTLWALLNVALLRDDAGNARGMLTFAKDISDRRRAEDEREEARRQAQEASSAKSQFIFGLTHELSTPLTTVLGFAELLEAAQLDEQAAADVQRIRRAAEHMRELVEDVLDLAQIEAGVLPLTLEPVDVRAIVSEAVDLLHPQAARAEVRVEVDGDGAIALADRRRVRQVLLNLLSNAIKYGPAGSRVGVSVATRDERVRVAVTDAGPGIAPDDQPRLFRPFERLGVNAEKAEGRGIGLALSKQLAEAMGGSLCLDPAAEHNRFWFELRAGKSR